MTTILVIVAGNSWIGGKSFEALNLGGSSSSQCRGMVMTLLAVDKSFYVFPFADSGLFVDINDRYGSFFRSGLLFIGMDS